MTPHDIHYGLAAAKWQQRAELLRAAYAVHPERFPHGVPVPPALPTAAWINKPTPRGSAHDGGSQNSEDGCPIQLDNFHPLHPMTADVISELPRAREGGTMPTWFLMILALAPVASALAADEPVRDTCTWDRPLFPVEPRTDLVVRIVGVNGDLIEIWDGKAKKQLLFDSSTREQMGGHKDALHCWDAMLTKPMIAINTGWQHDLLTLYGVLYDNNGQASQITAATWLPSDGKLFLHGPPIPVPPNGHRIYVVYGREADLSKSFCWNIKGDGKWWWSKQRTKKNPNARCDQEIPGQRVLYMK